MPGIYDMVCVIRAMKKAAFVICITTLVTAFLYGSSIKRHEEPKGDRNNRSDNDRLSSAPHRPRPVLLVTYLRSGSSWLGDVTQQAEGCFYVFEPLKYYIKEGYYKPGEICFNDDTCRLPMSASETDAFALQTLRDVFTCNFDRLRPDVIRVMRESDKSEYQARFRECLRRNVDLRECLHNFQSACLNSSVVMVKTIRLSMNLVGALMKEFPDLKVIHLVRDPRGITNSRRNHMFKLSLKTLRHSINVCSRMLDDVNNCIKLSNQFPGRVRTVLYEAMAENPLDAANYIYKFLRMSLPSNFGGWLKKHSREDINEFSTYRLDSAKTASKWRTELSFNVVRILDQECIELYKTLGFLPIPNEAKKADFNFTTRKHVQLAIDAYT